MIAHVDVRYSAKYLGIHIGPQVAMHRWHDALEKYWARGFEAAHTRGTFSQAIKHYHVFALSALFYVASTSLAPPEPFTK